VRQPCVPWERPCCERLSSFGGSFFLSRDQTDGAGTLPFHGTYWNIFLFSLEIDLVVDINDRKRYARNKKKTSRKLNFLRGGLAHGHEIFRVDAAHMAAHFPSRVVWGPYPTNGDIAPFRPSHAHFSPTLMHIVLSH